MAESRTRLVKDGLAINRHMVNAVATCRALELEITASWNSKVISHVMEREYRRLQKNIFVEWLLYGQVQHIDCVFRAADTVYRIAIYIRHRALDAAPYY